MRSKLAVSLALPLALSACIGGVPTNRGLESLHQPVVSHTDYSFDAVAGPGGLEPAEQQRLDGWFAALSLHYGDRLAIDDPMANPATRRDVAAIAGRHGLLVNEGQVVTQGAIAPGGVRIVLTRSQAHVPGCPDWSDKSDSNPLNATSRNYGCAVNSNLAAMVANPEDLIHGANGKGRTTVSTGSKAIDSWRDKKPTGAQLQLKTESTQNAGNGN